MYIFWFQIVYDDFIVLITLDQKFFVEKGIMVKNRMFGHSGQLPLFYLLENVLSILLPKLKKVLNRLSLTHRQHQTSVVVMVKNSTVQRLMVAVHSEMPLLSLERALELTLQPDRLSRKFWNLNSSVEEKDGAWMTDIIILLSGETNRFFFVKINICTLTSCSLLCLSARRQGQTLVIFVFSY